MDNFTRHILAGMFNGSLGILVGVRLARRKNTAEMNAASAALEKGSAIIAGQIAESERLREKVERAERELKRSMGDCDRLIQTVKNLREENNSLKKERLSFSFIPRNLEGE